MLKINNTEVYGFEAAIRGMRNPLNSWDKSDSRFFDYSNGDIHNVTNHYHNLDKEHIIINDDADHFESDYISDVVGPNDLDLMSRLAKAGTTHSKYRRMLVVSTDILAPLYWWKEFDTYKVGTVANSCSTMHKIQEKEFTIEDFSHENLINTFNYPEDVLDDASMEKCMDDHCAIDSDIGSCFAEPIPGLKCTYDAGEVIPVYILDWTIVMLNRARDLFLKTGDKKYWWQMIQLLPSSYNQKRTVMLNYEVLAGIYPNRKDHKLDEWHTFCDWIKQLPYADKLITMEE